MDGPMNLEKGFSLKFSKRLFFNATLQLVEMMPQNENCGYRLYWKEIDMSKKADTLHELLLLTTGTLSRERAKKDVLMPSEECLSA